MAPIDLGGAAKKAAGDAAVGEAGAPVGMEVTGAAPEEAAIGGLLGAGGGRLSGLMEKIPTIWPASWQASSSSR